MTDGPNTPLDPPPSRPEHTAPVHRPPIRRQVNDWTQEDEDRYQAERTRAEERARTRRRQGWSFFGIVAVVVLIGVLGAAINQGVVKWPFGGEPAAPCPAPAAAVKPSDVQIRVLNATGKAGLAKTVSADLAARGFKVIDTGNAAEDQRGFAEPAKVIYGEGNDQLAKVVAAQVSGAALAKDSRGEPNIDLLLGDKYTALAPADQAAKALQPAPVKSPEGCTPVAPTKAN